ncbi:MAG: hypothetical protein JWM36_2761 [Hyphomicrobiales bacterium]|nr:hypothetical protein [Hyphomicrobiales bacterium]
MDDWLTLRDRPPPPQNRRLIPMSAVMNLTMYSASVPVFLRALQILDTLLDEAEAHERAAGLAPDSLVEARLADDMLPLSGQVQRASDASKLAAVRLTGIEAPRFEDVETTFAQLHERIAKTIAFLQSIDAHAMDEADEHEVVVRAGKTEKTFRGHDYLLAFAIPNFFFHVTTAYAILRHEGVKIGKLDYLGG